MIREKFLKIIFVIVLLLIVSGCAGKQQSTDINGIQVEYEIDTKENNIVIDGYAYGYCIEDDGIVFIYPNNEEVLIRGSENSFSISSYSDEIEEYVSPEKLYEIYSNEKINFPYLNLIIVTVGILMLVIPKVFWYVGYGWIIKIDDIQRPIIFIRIIGMVVVILGFCL